MKSLLVTALSALLGLILTSVAAAQELQPLGEAPQAAPANPYPPPAVAQASAYQASPLPVAGAKKRYLATQQRLQNLVKGGSPQSLEPAVSRLENDLEVAVHEPRDRLRAAVADDFDARRQLQQAELAELEGRVARIKRALEIRDAMRDTIIDQRTDELLDDMEEAAKSGKRDGAAAPAKGRPDYLGPAGGAATVPGESNPDATQHEAQLLKLDVDEAKVNLVSAERAYDRALRLHQSGAISEEVFDEEEQKRKQAKIDLERAYLKAAAFQEAHARDRRATKEPPAGDGAVNDQPKTRRVTQLDLEVDVQEAEANLSTAKRAYDYAQKMHAKGYVAEGDVDTKAAKYKRAQLLLERAKANLKALDQPPAGDRALDEQTNTLSDQPSIEPPTGNGSVTDNAPN